MSLASLTTSPNANLRTAQTCGDSRTKVRCTAAIMRKAQSIFKVKSPAEVARYAKCCVRTAEYWKSEERSMGLEDFLDLLECDDAVTFLDVFWEFVPAVARARWLKQQVLNQRLEKAERKLAADKREADQLRFQLTNR